MSKAQLLVSQFLGKCVMTDNVCIQQLKGNAVNKTSGGPRYRPLPLDNVRRLFLQFLVL